ncbi:metal dependent phosphohydrolase [Candidatus Gastranaerophilus sp. (ex Termes propinquus)]|nr:metal dependent phosphohydrolase [Candidatus Gastranaerophilus sp. (ex Termes propinquus)]
MINISTESLINQKILPYDIYDVNKDKLFSAGEILTPGKIMSLKSHETLYVKQNDNSIPQKHSENTAAQASEKPAPKLQGKVNKTSKIAPQSQLSLKVDYSKAVELLKQGEITAARKSFLNIRDKIFEETQTAQKSVHYCSELKLLGEHHECHALNTAIFSAFLASRLEYSESAALEVILSALLHDIGKIKIPQTLFKAHTYSRDEEALYQKHPIYGYNIIKYKMKFPESVAKAALEHHETVDGAGWPYGISSTMISELSQIVAVSSCFDNLTSPQSGGASFKDALKSLLTKGSKTFSAKPLYAFVHMLNYSDSVASGDL